MDKIISTLILVVVAVGASAALWIGANLLFDQARDHWTRFSALAFGLVGFIAGVLLAGNRLTVGADGGFAEWVWLPALLAIVLGVLGGVVSRLDGRRARLVVAVSGLGATGAVVGALIRPEVRPAIEPLAVLGWTAALAGIGSAVQYLRGRRTGHQLMTAALTGGVIGWLIGFWGVGESGGGTSTMAIVGAALPAAVFGLRIGLGDNPDALGRARIDQRSRAVIFLGPAMLFILAALIVPAVRTIYLSLLDDDSTEWVGMRNYGAIFSNRDSWNVSNWTDIFTSRLFVIGAVLVATGALVALVLKRRTGRAVELGSPSPGPLVVGGLLIAFAAFTVLRGTIINNLWWVVTVTFASTALGLAVAVLADGARLERVAKSIIFMPMAISLVGAAIIWRFMYIARDTSLEQTGVMNAAWVALGRLSTGSGMWTIVGAVVIAIVLLGALSVLARSLVRREWARAVLPAFGVFLVGWFGLRYLTSGVGGTTVNAATGQRQASTVQFVQEGPFNNFWLMVILIWIQTGFAMVILSAAIRAVPEEYIEAARVDGATRSQIFWRIVLPQIATTIGVVVTTLIVLVMKVYDIVKVVTNGNFGTQVLANDMFNTAFLRGQTGQGAALAVLILISVLPVMYLNIRRMQENRS